MLIKPEPVYECFEALAERIGHRPKVVYLTPKGRVFNDKMAAEFAKESDLVLLAGHYEGIDERVLDLIVTDRVSIGDYVLTGGELPALTVIDAVARKLPGVLSEGSAEDESFSGCWNTPSTRVRKCLWENPFRRSYSPDITKTSESGGGSSRSGRR